MIRNEPISAREIRRLVDVFHLQKFPLGISVWKMRVPFVTISIRESRGRPGRLKDRERHGTGDKDEKSVNGTQISIGKFPPGKEGGNSFCVTRDCLKISSVMRD